MTTDASGQFEISASVGTYSVTVSGAGFAFETQQVVLASGTPAELTFELEVGLSISGSITQASDGSPISGATVTVISNSGISFDATADETGAFEIPDLADGVYQVVVIADGYEASTIAGLAISGSAQTTNVALVGGDTEISGTVTGPSGELYPTTVTITNSQNALVAKVTTDVDGSYVVSGIAPGNYSVTAQTLGYSTAVRSIDVAASATITGIDAALLPLAISDPLSGIVLASAASDDWLSRLLQPPDWAKLQQQLNNFLAADDDPPRECSTDASFAAGNSVSTAIQRAKELETWIKKNYEIAKSLLGRAAGVLENLRNTYHSIFSVFLEEDPKPRVLATLLGLAGATSNFSIDRILTGDFASAIRGIEGMNEILGLTDEEVDKLLREEAGNHAQAAVRDLLQALRKLNNEIESAQDGHLLQNSYQEAIRQAQANLDAFTNCVAEYDNEDETVIAVDPVPGKIGANNVTAILGGFVSFVPTSAKTGEVNVVEQASNDPNDKLGPAASGEAGYMRPGGVGLYDSLRERSGCRRDAVRGNGRDHRYDG